MGIRFISWTLSKLEKSSLMRRSNVYLSDDNIQFLDVKLAHPSYRRGDFSSNFWNALHMRKVEEDENSHVNRTMKNSAGI
jgi:hypothetical protein